MNLLSFVGGLGGQEIIVIFVLLLPGLFALAALIQCLKANFAQPIDRLVWVLVILLLPLVGSILWWTIGVGKTQR